MSTTPRLKVSDYLPKRIASGAVLTDSEHVHALASYLREVIGSSLITDIEVAQGDHDADPALREWQIPAVLSRRVERQAREEREAQLRSTPFVLLEDWDLNTVINLSAFDDDLTFHLSAKRAMAARVLAAEEQAQRDRYAARLSAIEAVKSDPLTLKKQANAGDWDGCKRTLLAYAETPDLVAVARVVSNAWVDRVTRTTVDYARSRVDMFLASNPELWSEK